MSRMKLAAVRVLVLMLMVVGLAVAVPAFSAPPVCPPGWDYPTSTAGQTEKKDHDKNNNGVVCSKQVNGRGNTGNGQNWKDDRLPTG